MYYGGKNNSGSYQHIISEIPLHDVYIEPFLGSGAVFRNKIPSRLSFLLDMDFSILQGFSSWTGFTMPAGTYCINANALEFLRYYPYTGQEFVYLDPPYLYSSRSKKSPVYSFEMGDDKSHKFLLDIISRLSVPVAISHYASSLYSSMLQGWRSKNWRSRTRRGVAVEYLFMNYPTPAILADPRYIGSNFTERQRLKRLIGVSM
jgi:site-specific DNA-adenine methylase